MTTSVVVVLVVIVAVGWPLVIDASLEPPPPAMRAADLALYEVDEILAIELGFDPSNDCLDPRCRICNERTI